MDIIKTYLDNMFASLPNTKDVNKMKQDLLLNMEEKYRELKNMGKSENEAIGIVISEFGNIDELANELGINIKPFEGNDNIVNLEESKEYLHAIKKYGKFIAFGVFLCILSPALLILLMPEGNWNLGDNVGTIIGFITLFVFVAVAVAIFIYAGINLEKFNHLKKDIIVPNNVKEIVKVEKNKFDPKFIAGLITSVTMFILSPITLIVISVINDSIGFDKYNYNIGVSVLLVLVAIGCLFIVRLGLIRDSHNVLLQLGDYTKIKKKADKIIGAIASIYWPIITAIYFIWSFLKNSWGFSWIIWPVAGIIFGGVSGIINASVKDE